MTVLSISHSCFFYFASPSLHKPAPLSYRHSHLSSARPSYLCEVLIGLCEQLPRAASTAPRWAAPLRKPLGSTFARYESTEGKVQGAVIGIDLGMWKQRKTPLQTAQNNGELTRFLQAQRIRLWL